MRKVLAPKSKYASVSEMVNNLGWRSLEQRRADARLCLL